MTSSQRSKYHHETITAVLKVLDDATQPCPTTFISYRATNYLRQLVRDGVYTYEEVLPSIGGQHSSSPYREVSSKDVAAILSGKGFIDRIEVSKGYANGARSNERFWAWKTYAAEWKAKQEQGWADARSAVWVRTLHDRIQVVENNHVVVEFDLADLADLQKTLLTEQFAAAEAQKLAGQRRREFIKKNGG